MGTSDSIELKFPFKSKTFQTDELQLGKFAFEAKRIGSVEASRECKLDKYHTDWMEKNLLSDPDLWDYGSIMISNASTVNLYRANSKDLESGELARDGHLRVYWNCAELKHVTILAKAVKLPTGVYNFAPFEVHQTSQKAEVLSNLSNKL